MAGKPRTRRTLSLERLEGRSLLAGDVMAKVIDGSLLVVGDKFDNAVVISQGAVAGDMVVSGHNDSKGNATTINGVPNGVVTLHGINKDLVATLMGGSDELILDRAEIAGNLTILTGVGRDTVSIGVPPSAVGSAADAKPDLQFPVVIGGNLFVDLGEGDDQSTLTGVSVGKSAAVSGGSGNNKIALGALDSGPAALATSASVSVVGNLSVNFASGNNILNAQSISVGQNLSVLAVTGVQEIHLDTVIVQNSLMLVTGDGTDNFSLANLAAHDMLLVAGAGADQILLSNTQVNSLSIFLGEGDDSVHAINVRADLYAVFFGGPGFDTYLEGAGPQPGVVSPRFRRFGIEQVIPLD